MMWKFIKNKFMSGTDNMKSDLLLAKSLEYDETILRLYQWDPYCISLGANQSMEDLLIENVYKDNIEIVKRPTGGRAILHSEELTYSVISQLNTGLSPKDLYKEINVALIAGLINFDDNLRKLDLHKSQPYFPSHYKEDKSAICFSLPSKNEISFCGKKLVGSAQRRIGNVLLQHGSILCGAYHKNICNYLALPESTLSVLRKEMDNNTTDLNEILFKEIEIDELAESIKSGFENHFAIKFTDHLNQYELTSTLN
ncbi:MAG: biotin/lipoate A/B protein ligase family protein [Ignavibacteriaceae bacterium]